MAFEDIFSFRYAGRVSWSVPEYYVQYVPSAPGSGSRRAGNKTKVYKRCN
jgi:hypothetical protein